MWLSAIKLAVSAGSKIYANKQRTKIAMSDAQLMHASRMAEGKEAYQGKLLEARQADYKGKSVPGKVKEFVKTGVKQTIGTVKKIGKKFRTKKMGGGMMMQRPMMEKGGSLKAVQPNQKGLKKLPTEVRNKMGYMKKGGKVNG